ncbi:MAG: hypothetical protein JNN15_21390, partial [Blastocatellia bacterium]|nr:hypothetical protein [Blastocatellia bacterium]
MVELHSRLSGDQAMAQPNLTDPKSVSAFSPPFANYQLDAAFDEMFATGGTPRIQYQALYHRLLELVPSELKQRQQTADVAFL